jgi:5-methylcytosine-specific restriction endonuclease McrA
LTADHIVPVELGGSSYISNIQPLCQTCNSSKGIRIIDYRTKPGMKRWVQPTLFG